MWMWNICISWRYISYLAWPSLRNQCFQPSQLFKNTCNLVLGSHCQANYGRYPLTPISKFHKLATPISHMVSIDRPPPLPHPAHSLWIWLIWSIFVFNLYTPLSAFVSGCKHLSYTPFPFGCWHHFWMVLSRFINRFIIQHINIYHTTMKLDDNHRPRDCAPECAYGVKKMQKNQDDKYCDLVGHE